MRLKDFLVNRNPVIVHQVFLKIKKNGELRVPIDYKDLNQITEGFNNTFPSVSGEFHKMAGCTVFSKLDLSKGYYQISVKKEDREKSAFTTPKEKYQSNKIPLGLKTLQSISIM
ncbi:putative LTR tranposable element [Pseudoloma neurophilia]|uniref:Putative LTR tranposable element n=1 Tax=Pseudoloma neurophilia TaxID=146866 RepID=A0A0R0LQU8_9MICR|nr:putative LTR tranposable element [Pseudoloma neurophilia]